jgi:hypothetical protein
VSVVVWFCPRFEGEADDGEGYFDLARVLLSVEGLFTRADVESVSRMGETFQCS